MVSRRLQGRRGQPALIISCSGWAHRRRRTSTCRPRPTGRSLPRFPSALWVGSAGGSSGPVGRRNTSYEKNPGDDTRTSPILEGHGEAGDTRNSTAAQSAASGSRQMWLGARRVRASGMHSYVLAGDRHPINSRLKENQESESSVRSNSAAPRPLLTSPFCTFLWK